MALEARTAEHSDEPLKNLHSLKGFPGPYAPEACGKAVKIWQAIAGEISRECLGKLDESEITRAGSCLEHRDCGM